MRAITKLPEIRVRSVVKSSVTASTKYSCSGSFDKLAKGRTTIDRRGAFGRVLARRRIEFVRAGAVTAGNAAAAAALNAYARTGLAMFFTLRSPMSSNG